MADLYVPQYVADSLAKNEAAREHRQQYMPYIQEAADKYDVPAGLLDMTLKAESTYNPNIGSVDDSSVGGLSQMQVSTAKGLGYDPAQLSDPETAINAMAKYYSQMPDTDDWGALRAGYMRGPAAAQAIISGSELPDSVGDIAKASIREARVYQNANQDSTPKTGAAQQANTEQGTSAVMQALKAPGVAPVAGQSNASQDPYVGVPGASGGNRASSAVNSVGNALRIQTPGYNDGQSFTPQFTAAYRKRHDLF